MMLGLDRGHFLSPTGQCKAFDASADGYSRSEGCGMFVLKRYTDAIKEKDNIHGLIRGIEMNQSGRASSITHPHAETQAQLFRRILDKSHLDPHRVTVVEAHGTGTQAGDPNELYSLRSVFSIGRPLNNPLHVTSVKANIGHLEAASGAASLAKVLLMLKYHTIPRLISLQTLNPRIAPLDADNTKIDTCAVPWELPDPSKSRIALINNFGAAGSNTAMIIEEYLPRSISKAPVIADTPFIFGLSAKTKDALEESRRKHLAWLQGSDGSLARISDIAYTMTARKQAFPWRLVTYASTLPELLHKLSGVTPARYDEESRNVVFVFSGQGSQYLGMGRDLYARYPLFRECIDDCQALLVSWGLPGIMSIINPQGDESGLPFSEEVQAYQSAIFSIECALSSLLQSWGLIPSAVVGHR
jgi:acyl transferase domain-containing protein